MSKTGDVAWADGKTWQRCHIDYDYSSQTKRRWYSPVLDEFRSLTVLKKFPDFRRLVKNGTVVTQHELNFGLQVSAEKPEHAIRAAELQTFSGMSTKKLAALFGVSKAHYNMWTEGFHISPAREGQLVFLHNLAYTVAQTVDDAPRWWNTPHIQLASGVMTPYDALVAHEWEAVHDFIRSSVEDDDGLFGRELPLHFTEADTDVHGVTPKCDHMHEGCTDDRQASMGVAGDVVWAEGLTWVRAFGEQGETTTWHNHYMHGSTSWRTFAELEKFDDFSWLVKNGQLVVCLEKEMSAVNILGYEVGRKTERDAIAQWLRSVDNNWAYPNAIEAGAHLAADHTLDNDPAYEQARKDERVAIVAWLRQQRAELGQLAPRLCAHTSDGWLAGQMFFADRTAEAIESRTHLRGGDE